MQWQQALFSAGLLPAGSPSPTSRSTKEQGRPPAQKKRRTPKGGGKSKRYGTSPGNQTNKKQKSETSRTAAQTTSTTKGEMKRATGKHPGSSEATMPTSRTAQQTPQHEAPPLVRPMQTAARPTPTLVLPLPSDLTTSNRPVKVHSERDAISVCCFSLDGTQLKASLPTTLEQHHRAKGPSPSPTATPRRCPSTYFHSPNINLGGCASSAGALNQTPPGHSTSAPGHPPAPRQSLVGFPIFFPHSLIPRVEVTRWVVS